MSNKDLPSAIRAAIANENVTYIDLPVSETTQKLTAGWTDDDIRGFDQKQLDKLLEQIEGEYQQCLKIQESIIKRRTDTLAVMRRKAELG